MAAEKCKIHSIQIAGTWLRPQPSKTRFTALSMLSYMFAAYIKENTNQNAKFHKKTKGKEKANA